MRERTFVRVQAALLTAGLIAAVTGALAQQPPTDSEIAAEHANCNRPENFVPIGSVGNRPPNAGQYKDEEMGKRCKLIDAEYEKRALKQKADDAAAHKRMDEIIKLIPK